jgi:hypothetical protein
MSKTYYAADNEYGNEFDCGFSNTWYVIAFTSKKARDEYVRTSKAKSTRAIKAREIKKYGRVSFRQLPDGELEPVI